MSKLKTLEDLFEHQLKDLYSAESQLLDALPKMVKKATNPKLKEALKDHLAETKKQKERLEEIGKKLDMKLGGEKCKAMEGLIKEAEDLIDEAAEASVKDAGIIADAQRVEHYEISAYGTAIAFSKELGKNDVAKILLETLKEEKKADDTLNEIAKSRVNTKAKKA